MKIRKEVYPKVLDAPRTPNKRQPPGTCADIARLPYESAV